MAINYPAMRLLAERLIRENGVAATLEREEPGAYDPVADTDVAVLSSYAVSVLLAKLHQGVDDFDWQALRDIYEVGRTTKIYLAGEQLPAGVEPQEGDAIRIGATGEVWIVRANNPIRPAGAPVLHILFATRGAVR